MDAIKEGMLASAKAAEAAVRIGERLYGQNTPSVMNFSSQICTTREQSERLIALGLKKETADMYYSYDIICAKPYHKVVEFMNGCVPEDIFPAWSFGRLLEIFLESDSYRNILFVHNEDHMEYLLRHIEIYIKEGYLDERYLV